MGLDLELGPIGPIIRAVNTRRTQILDAASDLIAEQGFAQTSVDAVIERAGLSGKSHFYHYFKSKDALGHEVLTRQFDVLGERGLAIQVDRGLKGGSPFGALATDMAEKDEGFRVRIARVFRNWTDEIAGLLTEAADRLEEDADPKRLARFIVATLEGATTMARMKRDMSVMHGVATDLKRFLSGHLRRPAAN